MAPSFENGDTPSSPIANDFADPSSPAQRNSSTVEALPASSSGQASTPAARGPTSTSPAGVTSTSPAGLPKHVEDVMYSDIGINTLLNRLKQSIASARDFASFLQKRSKLEEEHSHGLRKLVRAQELRRADLRGGSYAQQQGAVMQTHDAMSENEMQFALSLSQMADDITTLSNNIERGRKQWKHEGLEAERKASEAENLMQKAKSRYDQLAESLDRARTGDIRGSRRIGLKGPNAEDLSQKVMNADQEYQEKIRQAKAQREHLLSTSRPAAVRALHELIRECDTGLALQLQKYATFNEKLLLGNGLAVSPLGDKEAAGSQKSLRDLIAEINNEDDYNMYVGANYPKITRPSEIKYERHPTLAPKTQMPTQPSSFQAPLTLNTQPSSMTSRAPSQPQTFTSSQGQSFSPSQPQTFAPSQQQALSPSQPQSFTPSQQQTFSPAPSSGITSAQPHQSYGQGYPSHGQPPYPIHNAERNSTQQPPQAYTQPQSIAAPPSSKTSRPVFGVSLEELFQRDETPVPIIVHQCVQAVELFGLDVEGIYRQSGTSRLVTELREKFDNNEGIDMRVPASFYHDVNSVTALLKQFFRSLPSPLFPQAAYSQFIDAARLEDEFARRDVLHGLINDLPDANYATLRTLVLHLHRVMQHESRNRMGASNLAICFAPSLMGAHTGPQIADAGLQAKVLDTILINATAIFDED